MTDRSTLSTPARAARPLLLAGATPLALLLALTCSCDASAADGAYETGGSVAELGAGAQDPAPRVQEKKTPQTGGDEKKQGDDTKLPPGLGKDEGARLDYAVGSQNHKFGNLMQGAVASHTFDLTARGTEDLVIKNVKPTCGCTVAQVLVADEQGEMQPYTYGDAIPVGREIEIPAKLHTKNKNGHANTRINIFSNDPRGTIQLGLEADITPFFNLSPRFLNFNRMQLGEVQTQTAVISTAGNQPIALTLLDPSIPSGAKTELTPLNPNEEGKSSRWQLTVTLGPDLVEGNLARALVLQSDVEVPSEDADEDHADHDHATTPQHQEFYQASITLSAQVVGPFTYTPNYLSMGLVRPGQVVARTIRIECNDESYSFAEKEPTIRIAGLPVPGGEGYQDWDRAEYFSYTVRPVENANAVDVELRLEGLPEGSTGSFRGTMLVELDHPDKKEIALTITGVCRGGPVPPRPPRPSGGGDGQ
jgi:hypothetical protein